MYFISKDDEFCYSKEAIKEYMVENGFNEIEVFQARKITGIDFFFCKKVGEVGEKKFCGNFCKDYLPRNHKTGCCKFFGYCYENTNQIKKIKI